MHACPVHELRVLVGLVVDRGEDEGGRIEHGAERGDPRRVVVGRTEQHEDRIRHVTLEDVGNPSLPLREQLRQRGRHACVPHPVEQLWARGRRPGPSVEQQHAHLTTVERLVEDREVGDHHGEEPQSGRPREDHDGPGPTVRRRGPDPEREQR